MTDLLNPALFSDPQSGVILLASLLLKGLLVLAVAGLIAWALRKQAAASRHLVWTLGIVTVLALPFLTSLLPQWSVPVLPAASEEAPAAVVATVEASERAERTTEPVAPVAPAPAASSQEPTPRPRSEATQPTPEATRVEQVPAPGVFAVAMGWAQAFHWTTWVVIIWLGVALAILARLIVAHIGISRMVRRARVIDEEAWHDLADIVAAEMGVPNFVRLRWSPSSSVPLMVGVFRPVIMLPPEARQWSAERRKVVLRHEMAHVRRRDCLTQLLAQVTCAFHWFNPLVWVAANQLLIERERACDDLVLQAGTRASAYAETLLETAQSLRSVEWSSPVTLAMARRSQLEGRLLAILDDDARVRTFSWSRGAATSALFAALMLPLIAMKPAPAASERQPALAPVAEADTDRVAIRRSHVPHPPEPPDVGHTPVVVLPQEAMAPEVFVIPDPEDFDYDFDFDFDYDFDFDFDHDFDFDVDPGSAPLVRVHWDDDFGSEALGDSLSLEQIIRLRRYGVTPAFIRGLRDLGYTDLTLNEVTALARYDATPEYIRSLQQAGFSDLSVDALINYSRYDLDPGLMQALRENGYGDVSAEELLMLARYDVDPDYINELQAAGLRDLSLDELAQAGRYDLDAETIAAVRSLGYTDLRMNDYLQLARYDIDAEEIRGLHDLGYTQLSVTDLINLSRYDVDANEIAALRNLGYTDLSVEALTNLSRYDVDADEIAALHELGYTNLPVEKMIDLSRYDVDARFVRNMQGAGLGTLSVGDLINLSRYDIDGDYVRALREAGLENLTVERVIDLSRHDIDGDYIREMRGVTGDN